MGLPRRLRLKHSRRIHEVLARGRKAGGRLGTIYALERYEGPLRVCLRFPGGTGTAVARNRGRRRLQECFRALEPRIQGAWDVVFRARRGAVEMGCAAVKRDLEELLLRLGLLE